MYVYVCMYVSMYVCPDDQTSIIIIHMADY